MHCFLITASSTPPKFTQEPQDTVVFAYDAAGNNASLFLTCTATGNPFPDIVWYREEQNLSNEVILADGSLLIENIVEGVDATREGLLYYCSANNTFGIIRSRVANVSYACRWKKLRESFSMWNLFLFFLLLFLIDFNGFGGPDGIDVVNVTTGINGDVALECLVRHANPPPRIEWFDGNGTLIEAAINNTLRFLDNGRYLLIRGLTTTQVSMNYHCEVTNAFLYERVRSPTTYSLDINLGSNDTLIYKAFESKVTLVGERVELSFIAGAGSAVEPFGLQNCQLSGSTLTTPLDLTPIGGVIAEPIPSAMDNAQFPTVAESVSFEVNCNFVAGTYSTSVQATLTVHGRYQH